MKAFNLKYKLLFITVIALFVWAIAADIPFTFKAGDLISAEQMNENFTALNTGKQERVADTCAAGSAIRAIASDGSVTCEVDDIGSGGGSGVDAINGQTGAVTLQAGDNITIDDSTQGQIVISATTGGTNGNAHDHFGQTWTGSSPTSGLSVINTNPDNDGSVALIGRISTTTASLGLNAIGVWGEVPSGAGVAGSSPSGFGVYGFSTANRGVYGTSESSAGVYGESSTGNGVSGISETGYGVSGQSSNFGIYGKSPLIAVRGEGEFMGVNGSSTLPDGIGVTGSNTANGTGVQGISTDGTGVYGQTSGSNYGVRGYSPSGRGVFGESQSGVGVYGFSFANDAAVGVTGPNDTAHAAIAGSSDKGYAAYFEAGLGVGQGYATCTFRAGTTNWACSSDKNLKDNFEAVNPMQILESVAHLPVTTWTMKGSTVRQMGPTSQDFYAAFKLGDNDKSINNTDAQGVAFAAIQGLYQLVQEQQVKIEALEAQLAARK